MSARKAEGGKHQRILEAVMEIIAERGSLHVPVSAIAARAGVADGTIYLYFRNKEEMLRLAMEESYERSAAQVRERLAAFDDPGEQLLWLAEQYLEEGGISRSQPAVELLRQQSMRYLAPVQEIVQRGKMQGLFRADVQDDLAAHCVLGALENWLCWPGRTGHGYDAKTVASTVLALLLRGMTVGEYGGS